MLLLLLLLLLLSTLFILLMFDLDWLCFSLAVVVVVSGEIEFFAWLSKELLLFVKGIFFADVVIELLFALEGG